jgi:hypothetical protein
MSTKRKRHIIQGPGRVAAGWIDTAIVIGTSEKYPLKQKSFSVDASR